MSAPFATLKLSTDWDLSLDGSGDLAVTIGSEAVIQDVSSVALTFRGEVWYDTTAGVPYFAVILGEAFNQTLFNSLYSAAARTVPGVVQAQAIFDGLTPERKLVGSLQVIDLNGQALNASF